MPAKKATKATTKKVETAKAAPKKSAVAPAAKKTVAAKAAPSKAATAKKAAAAPAKKSSPAAVKNSATPAKKVAAPVKKSAPAPKPAAAKAVAASRKPAPAPAPKAAVNKKTAPAPKAAPAKKAAPVKVAPKPFVPIKPAKAAPKKAAPAKKAPSVKAAKAPDIKLITVPRTISAAKTPSGELTARAKHFHKIRDILLRQKQTLLTEAEQAMNALPEQTVFPDLGDQATAETDRNFMLRLRGREQKLIKKIEEAIERIDTNEYGLCDSCGEEIQVSRLEARPVTTMCIDCKTEQEEEERLQGE